MQDLIEQLVNEIRNSVRQEAVEAISQALGNGKAPKAKPIRRNRRNAADVEALASQTLRVVRANPGERLGDIAKRVGQPTPVVRAAVKRLRDDKLIRIKGERAAARYFVSPRGKA